MKKSITQNYIYNVIYQVLVLMAPLITAPYLARVLGAEQMGIYSYVASTTSLISTIGLLGIYDYGVRQIAYCDFQQERAQTFWEIVIIRACLLLPGLVIYGICAAVSQYAEYFIYYALWIIASYVDLSWIYVGTENMKPTVLKNITAKVICIIGIFTFVRDKDDLWKYLLLIAVATFLANMSLWTVVKQYIKYFRFNMRNLWKHLCGGMLLFIPQVTTTIYLQVDKIMLGCQARPEQVSFYDQSEKLINIPLAFIAVLSTVMMPRIASEYRKKNKDNIKVYIEKAMDSSMLLAGPMVGGIVGIAAQLIPWYLGNEFTEAINVIYVLSPMIVFNALAGISGKLYFTATNQINILIKSYSITAVLNVIINTILIPYYGAVGAAVATVVSSVCAMAIQYYYLLKEVHVKMLKMKYLNYTVSSIVVCVVALFIGREMGVSILTTAVQIFSGACIYFGIQWIFRDDTFIEVFRKILKMIKIRQ